MTTAILVSIITPIALIWGGSLYVSQIMRFADDAERGALR